MISEKFLAELKQLLGAGDDMTADNAVSYLRRHLEQQDQRINDIQKQLINRRASLSIGTGPDPDSAKSMLLGAGVKDTD